MAAVALQRDDSVRRRRQRSCLEDRLASADAKRQQLLDSVVERASLRHAEVQSRAAALAERRLQLAAQLEESLQHAEGARLARLEAKKAKAGHRLARVRQAAAEHKLRAAREAAQREQELVRRVERARTRRQEALQAMLSAVQAKHSGAHRERLRLRRSPQTAAAAKVAAAWRTFCQQQQTTRALAQTFVSTGVPFTVPLGQEARSGPSPTQAVPVPGRMEGQSLSATPASTPDPCGSPTSTVRRHDGRLASAPVSMPTTPNSTPIHTSAPSMANSPTAAASSAMHSAAPLAMPPLRSIAAPANTAEAPEPGAFERLAGALSAPATLKAAQALLRRLESRVTVKGVSAGCCAGLLRRLFARAPPGRPQERYPPRIFLCAYMVLAHPEVVFNVRGDREAALSSAGRDMLVAFEALLERLTHPSPPAAPGSEGAAGVPTLAEMLQTFDERWVAYLEQFVCWKSADAAGLEMELVRVAVELERSRLAKMAASSTTPRAARLRSPEDMQAIANAVDHDLELIAERVRRLTGAQGAVRLEAALAAVRAAAAAEQAAQQREAAAGSDGEPSSPMRISPSHSPVKKSQRTGSFRSDADAPGAPTPEPVGGLSRSSSAMSFASSTSGAASSDARPPATSAVDMEAALAQHPNLGMAWHLIRDPAWQLPTRDLDALWADALGQTDPMAEPSPTSAQEEAASLQAVQLRVKRIAERAFWDAVQERLMAGSAGDSAGSAGGQGRAQEGSAALEQVAGLLADLGRQLADVLPESAGQEVAARLDASELAQALVLPSGAGLNAPALLGLLDWFAGVVGRYGAPARDAAAAQGQAAVRQQLQAAGGEAAGTVAAMVRALRLLTVQLKLLRVDIANTHLRLLSAQMDSAGAVGYARAKFEAMLGRPDGCPEGQLGAALPHARAMLAGASSQLALLETQPELCAGLAQSEGGTSAPGAQLPHLRTGLGGAPGSSATRPRETVQLRVPAALRSWQGLVRLGLIRLITSGDAIGRVPLPETLCLDGMRLHDAQGEFQRLLVLATCLQLMKEGGSAPRPAEVLVAKRRLLALLADPSVRLPDLAAEVARVRGCEAEEQAVQEQMHAALSRSSDTMKALTSGMTTALLLMLLRGADSPAAQEHASLALRRCGAGDLVPEAASLAAQLAGVAAISEAVCGAWFQHLSSDLL